MRLINTTTLALHDYLGDPPRYAILSHTWETDEVSLQEFTALQDDVPLPRKQGFTKIQNACELARSQGFEYAWVDTCCIDKSSSAELTEALNSMFTWYQNAEVCYALLADLPPTSSPDSPSSLEKCRWFTRGWTLQELIAPRVVEFYDSNWTLRGTKASLSEQICSITSITEDVLRDSEALFSLCVAQRMSWAAGRETTRIEDGAYCLLGVFGVHMPMLYGEGSNAFLRLQEEIARRVNDATLFAWTIDGQDTQTFRGVFAPSAANFARAKDIRLMRDLVYSPSFTITNKGLQLTEKLIQCRDATFFLGLGCHNGSDMELGIWTQRHGGGVCSRVRADELPSQPEGEGTSAPTASVITLSTVVSAARSAEFVSGHSQAFILRRGITEHFADFPFVKAATVPAKLWSSDGTRIVVPPSTNFNTYVELEPRNDTFWPSHLIVAFGWSTSADQPWICIGDSKGDDPEAQKLREALGEADAVDALRRKRRISPTVLLKDHQNFWWKAVTAAFHKVVVGAQVRYYIDLTMDELATQHLLQQQSAIYNPLNPDQDMLLEKAKKIVGDPDPEKAKKFGEAIWISIKHRKYKGDAYIFSKKG